MTLSVTEIDDYISKCSRDLSRFLVEQWSKHGESEEVILGSVYIALVAWITQSMKDNPPENPEVVKAMLVESFKTQLDLAYDYMMKEPKYQKVVKKRKK